MHPIRHRARSRARSVGAVVGACLLAIAGIASTPTVAAAAPLGDLTFHGRGYGHGVGMSQYGARGRALAGQIAPTILAHYYPATTIGWPDDSAGNRSGAPPEPVADGSPPATRTSGRTSWKSSPS